MNMDINETMMFQQHGDNLHVAGIASPLFMMKIAEYILCKLHKEHPGFIECYVESLLIKWEDENDGTV